LSELETSYKGFCEHSGFNKQSQAHSTLPAADGTQQQDPKQQRYTFCQPEPWDWHFSTPPSWPGADMKTAAAS
jgi:hypothetical protein